MGKYFTLLILVLIEIASADAQHSILGKLKDLDSGLPVYGARMVLHETGRGALSDSAGVFEIKKVNRGVYHLHISAYGFEAQTRTVKIDSTDIHIEIVLKSTPVELMQIILEGEYLKTEREKQSLSIDVVDSDYLTKNSGSSFAETIDKIPGVASLTTGVGISKPVLRGMSSNRLIVNENGIKQQGQQWGSDHGLEIDQSGIGQVEIVKGPVAYIYGSDGIGGVINLKPLAVPDTHSLAGEITTFFRSNNNTNGITGSIAARRKNTWIRTRYSDQRYGDYKIPADSFTYLDFRLPIYNNKLKNTAGKIQSAALSAGYLGAWGKISISISNYFQKAGFFPGAIGIPNTFSLKDDGSSRNINLPFQQLNHFKIALNSEIFSGHNWLETDIAYQLNNRQERSQPHAHGNIVVPEGETLAHGWTLQTYTFNTRYNIALADSIKMIAGLSGEMQDNRKEGFEFLLPDYQTFNSGVFAVLKYNYSRRLSLNAGLRGDASHITSEEFREDLGPAAVVGSNGIISPAINKNYLTWSGGAGFSYAVSEKRILRFNLGRSYRLPTVPELTMNGVHHGTFRHEQGDPNLKPENGIQTDIGFEHSSQKFVFKASPFFNYFSNYIFLRPTVVFSNLPDGGQIYRYTQTRAIYSGFEMSGEYHPLKYLHLESGAEYVATYNLNNGLPLPFIPPFTFTTEAELTRNRINQFMRKSYAGIQFTYYAAQNRTDRNEKKTPGAALFNINTGTTLNIGGNNVELLFRVNNILNTKYYKHLSRYRFLNLPEPGRNYIVTLKIPIRLI